MHSSHPSERPQMLLWGGFMRKSKHWRAFSSTDPKTVVDGLLADGIPALQNNMASMSLGCPAGTTDSPQKTGVRCRATVMRL